MDLNEYQKNLDNFYKLKNKYHEKINREKQKLISNTELSKKEKRLQFMETVNKCINCKNKGGTIFEINKDYYKITCGNTENPCNLNVYFKRQQKELLNERILEYIKIISDIKNNIIKIKLDYILGFITEEESIIKFTSFKKELDDNYNIYKINLEDYIKITNNLENQEEISNNMSKKNDIILDIKKHVEKFKSNNNVAEITEIIEIYTTDLENILKTLRELQYRKYYISTEGDENRLIKETYTIKDLEIDKIER